MAATMPSAVLWARERTTTSKPCTATVSAMPEPMIPEPTIPTLLIDMGGMLPVGYLGGPPDTHDLGAASGRRGAATPEIPAWPGA